MGGGQRPGAGTLDGPVFEELGGGFRQGARLLCVAPDRVDDGLAKEAPEFEDLLAGEVVASPGAD